jgi:hypothetical protein
VISHFEVWRITEGIVKISQEDAKALIILCLLKKKHWFSEIRIETIV